MFVFHFDLLDLFAKPLVSDFLSFVCQKKDFVNLANRAEIDCIKSHKATEIVKTRCVAGPYISMRRAAVWWDADTTIGSAPKYKRIKGRLAAKSRAGKWPTGKRGQACLAGVQSDDYARGRGRGMEPEKDR